MIQCKNNMFPLKLNPYRSVRLFFIYSPGGTLEINNHPVSCLLFNIFTIYWKHNSLYRLNLVFFPRNVSIFRLSFEADYIKVREFIRIRRK